MADPLADYGEFARLAPVLLKLDRAREHGLDDGAVFLLPMGILPGVTRAYGLAIVRAEVPEPMIGLPGQGEE